MTCHEARELFSAVEDDALDAGEQATLDAHLIGCADCRRELDRFRRTVALVQGLPPERAPAGFVDRVVASVQPQPWYVRLARGLFVPWATKLPQEAAAVILIAGLAVWVLQRTPEQQQSARLEQQAPPRAEAPAPVEPLAPPPDAPIAPDASTARNAQITPPAPTAPAPAPAPSATPEKQETGEARRLDLQAPRALQKPREEATREPYASRDALDKRRSSSVQGMTAPEPAADVSGRLVIDDPAGGATKLGDLARRLGGSVAAARSDVAGTRSDGDERLVELTVPRDRYPDFAREIARIGRWQPEPEAAALPETVRVRVRITR